MHSSSLALVSEWRALPAVISFSLQLSWLARNSIVEDAGNPMIVFKGVCVAQMFRHYLVNLSICLNAGQVITASIADIIANYSFKDILRKLTREKQTEVAPASYDDSYLGEVHCSGHLFPQKTNIFNVWICFMPQLSDIIWHLIHVFFFFMFQRHLSLL